MSDTDGFKPHTGVLWHTMGVIAKYQRPSTVNFYHFEMYELAFVVPSSDLEAVRHRLSKY